MDPGYRWPQPGQRWYGPNAQANGVKNISTSTNNLHCGVVSPHTQYDGRSAMQGFRSQYSYGQNQTGQGDIELPHPELRSDLASGDINLNELGGFSRPVHEGPWSAAGNGVRLNESVGHIPYQATAVSTRPATIAHPEDETFQRPQLHDRVSHTSFDSGFQSARPNYSQELQSVPETPGHGYLDTPSWPEHPRASSVKSEPHYQSQAKVKKTGRRSKAGHSFCPLCGKLVKNQSDAKKHSYQHTKPYYCRESKCSRVEGFATENDLERHRKSVHGVHPRVGKQTGYICQACPYPPQGNEQKFWPRLDNFKAHTGRKHKDCNIQELVKASERLRPPDAISDSGFGSQPAQSQAPEGQEYQQDLSSPVAPAMSRRGSKQDCMNMYSFGQGQFDHQQQLAHMGGGPMIEPYANNEHDIVTFTAPGWAKEVASQFPQAGYQVASPVDSILPSPAAPRPSNPRISVTHEHTNIQYDPLDQASWHLRPVKRQKTSFGIASQDGLNAMRTPNGEYICRQCDKVRKRECDLRKHMKRHTRPYGCTFQGCTKRFGSRNDWKRHENSQHFLQESWRCELRGAGVGKCGKLVYDRETFEIHLRKKHTGISTPLIEEACKQMHIGREGHYHFWCGFCNALIAQNDDIHVGAWDRRFKHIGDHFDKGNYHIDDWIDIEQNKKKSLITKEDRKWAKTRSRNGQVDDDSDLPDDGIPSYSTANARNPGSLKQDPEDCGARRCAQTACTAGRRMSEMDVDADGVSDPEW